MRASAERLMCRPIWAGLAAGGISPTPRGLFGPASVTGGGAAFGPVACRAI
ncbi:MAG TPA: hypothetical protein VJ456_11525 [Acidimicrobiia bacterium]|nr:hypothetical protein [Acidimicrobiia bacterium]